MSQHSKQWEFLKSKFEANQLSHAYLFSGQDVAEITAFVKQFMQLVCPGFDAVIEKESFPDLFVVKSINSDSSLKNERDMMEIDVAQIRDVNAFLSLKSYYGGYKTVMIDNADRMNHEAQNSFLKTLEEPKGQTLIILISSKPDTLLPTIFSRCQTITFSATTVHQNSKEETKLLQELLNILPMELATKFQYTKKANLEGDNAPNMLRVLQRYLRSALLAKIGASTMPLPSLFRDYPIEKLKRNIQLVESLHKQLTTTNASPKLALEILLLEF